MILFYDASLNTNNRGNYISDCICNEMQKSNSQIFFIGDNIMLKIDNIYKYKYCQRGYIQCQKN